MAGQRKPPIHERWAHLRFSVVGPLLAAPSERGQLQAELARLAEKKWRHPVTEQPVQFGVSTIERWYYRARGAHSDPVGELRRKVRKDSGQQPAMTETLRPVLIAQYREHRSWSYQLHLDNLRALAALEPALGSVPAYATVLRFMKRSGMRRQPRRRTRDTAGVERAEARLEEREVRSFEATHVNGLWHLDFHLGSLRVLLPNGEWKTPWVLAVMDDRSRLCCHAQWYFGETAEHLVHGLSQALQKRELPRALLTDNGSAMMAAETTEGLTRLGIVHETTLPHSPYQNGKQECFWAQLEGRLMAMLERCRELTLALLNEATQAWVEMEYNRAVHSETAQTPLRRYLDGPDVGRPSPASAALRLAFCGQVRRTQRRSDGTISIEAQRFEIPSRYRHLEHVFVRYARWDLSHVHHIDEKRGTALCRLYPLDKEANADGVRRVLPPGPLTPEPGAPPPPRSSIAPLLRKLMADYAATGLPPAYLPKEETTSDDNTVAPTTGEAK